MPKNTVTVIAVVVAILAAGVAGVIWATGGNGITFKDVALNKDLPNDYKMRVLWSETDAFKYNLDQLAGHVVIGNKDTGIFSRGARYLQAGYQPAVKIPENGTIYDSKVDKSASSKGEFLGFAGNLDAKQTAEVTIADTSTVFIPWDKIDKDGLLNEADKPVDDGQIRYFIQGVVLATVTIRNYTEVGTDVSAIQGGAFGANGKIYSESEGVSRDYQISLTLLPLRELSLANFSETELKKIVVPADFTIKSIKNLKP